MDALINNGPRSIRVDVHFFDEAERAKLSKYPTYPKIVELVRQGVQIPAAQFLTYYLFHKKRPGMEGYRSYDQIGLKIARAVADLEDWVHYVDGSLVSDPGANPPDLSIVERLGEAVSLSMIGEIHGLHEADWDRIPPRPGPKGVPTFDYQHPVTSASDGDRIVQVEAKGTHSVDASTLSQNVKAQKKRIDDKKHKLAHHEAKGQYPYPADLRYGAITAVGTKGPLNCWLTDPPVEGETYPKRHRLLARLQFVLDWLIFLKPRSPITASLATRIGALGHLSDPFELDGVALRNARGETFDLEGESMFGEVPPLFASMSRVADGPAVGAVVPSTKNRILFLGIQDYLIRLTTDQKFSPILGYADHGGTVEKRVVCKVPRARAERMGLQRFIEKPDSAYAQFYATGSLHYGRGSSVFGFLVPEDM